jgi:YYY domain-containing protein
MLAVLSWWLIMEVIGLLALPLALRLFRHLPERGYAFARPLGFLLAGYLLWVGASFGFLSNSRTAILFVMLLVGLASFVLWRRDRGGITSFLSQNRRVIIVTELVFALAFFGWALVRAYNPDIAATEKPMEIAFLNTILRSERFPPHDPWLSGFAISYYYFGYLLMAMLTKLSGVAASVAFNLAISLLFALTATGSFSLVYNLLATDRGQRVREGLSSILWALLGPLFVVIIGNLEGFFEVLHSRGLGSPTFWRWLDIQGLTEAPVTGRWAPTDMWWWWRASRVVNDRDLSGNHMEVIDEFPQFSFLLGDMHPHVLALPFVLLALGLALNVLLGARTWMAPEDVARTEGSEGPAAGGRHLFSGVRQLLFSAWQHRAFDLLMLALCLGALGFLNTWDFPIHLSVVVAAFLAGQRVQQDSRWLASTLVFALSVAVPAVLLYLPFYLGFQSQAAGVLPLFFNVTRVHQYLMMFGLFVFVIVSLIVLQLGRRFACLSARERRGFWLDLSSPLLWLVAGPVLLMAVAVLSVTVTSRGKQFLQGVLADERVRELIGSTGVVGLLRRAVLLRLTNPWTFLLVAILIGSLWYLIQHFWRGEREAGATVELALLFVYLISAVSFLLTLAVEFVYLRDLFGTRMNTVFKFYYQAWVMMGIAAAFGSYYILGHRAPSPRGAALLARSAWLVSFVALVLMGIVYPLLAIPNKAGDFKGKPTLDGMAFLQNVRADDYAAIQWLQTNVAGIAYLVEASGGSYSDAGFVSAFTGLPTVLGWDFHQYQWRGNTIESGKRQPDIAQIYQNANASEVLTLLDKYDIKYVYLGPVEKRTYDLAPQVGERIGRFLEKVYEGGNVSIYRR